MSFFKKIGGFLKKAAPAIGTVAGSIFGGPAGGAIGSALGGLFSAKSSKQTMGDPNVGPQQPQVEVTGQRPGIDWGGIAQSVAPLAAGALNYYGQRQTNAANAQQAQAQMDFQNQQTSTSYQRGTADMRAAGLNPLLAYSQGGAGSGSGAMATMGNEIGSGANSALSSAQTLSQIQNLRAQNDQIYASTDLTEAQAQRTRIQAANDLADNPRIKNVAEGSKHYPSQQYELATRGTLQNYLMNQVMESEIASAKATASYKGSQAQSAKYGLAKDETYNRYYRDSGKLTGGGYEPWRQAIRENVSSAGQAVRDASSIYKLWD